MRHSESELKKANQTDFERDLTLKGKKLAKKQGEFLRSLKIPFDKIIASSAKRTIETANLLASTIKFNPSNIESLNQLYLASESVYLEQIFSLSEESQHVIIIGHNPGITTFSQNLVSDHFLHFSPADLLIVSTNSWTSFDFDTIIFQKA